MTPPTASAEQDERAQPSFSEIVRLRKSYRSYLDRSVPHSVIQSVLEDARLTPSNCNTQPWHIHIVSGAKLAELSRALLADFGRGKISPDFTFDMSAFQGCYGERKDACAEAYYTSLGIARGDHKGRRMAAAKNLTFFGAPHACLLFMPSIGDNVRVAGDIGMYAQTFLLSLTAHNLGGIAQTMLGFYADAVRKCLNIPDDQKFLFGISFGYPDPSATANKVDVGRAPINQTVTFHE